MRLVKLGLISAVVMFLLVLLLSLLIPSHSLVSRAITINRPFDSVKVQVADLRNWQYWNALLKDSSLGVVQFSERNISTDRMKIELIAVDSTAVITQWKREGQEPVQATMSLTAAGNSTILQWYFDFHLKWYPWEKFGSIVFDKELGPPMEASLDQLKKIAEKQPG